MSSSNKSESFTLVFDKQVSSGERIKNGGKTMYITKIKKVEVTSDGKLNVEGLWKEDQVSRMLRKYGRN